MSYTHPDSMRGQVAIVTGAAQGVGKGIAAALLERGAAVLLVDILDEKLNAAVGASEEARKRLYGEIQRQIIGQAYAVPLYVAAYRLGATKSLHGISWATNAKPNFYDASLGP